MAEQSGAARQANLEMLLDIVRKARHEGWYEEDPGWRLADDLIARIDGSKEGRTDGQ